MLRDLEGHGEGSFALALSGKINIDLQCVIQRRNAVWRELDVNDWADDASDATFRFLFFLAHSSSPCSGAQPATNASAPPTISLISWVMSA